MPRGRLPPSLGITRMQAPGDLNASGGLVAETQPNGSKLLRRFVIRVADRSSAVGRRIVHAAREGVLCRSVRC